jgi:hypothetical protein
MDITQKTVVELKALAFDLILEQERVSQNLRIVNAEIAKKLEAEKKEEK